MGLERVAQLALSHVEDTDVSLLAGADEGLVLGRIYDGRTTVVVTRERCKTCAMIYAVYVDICNVWKRDRGTEKG